MLDSNAGDIQQKRFDKELKLLSCLVGIKTYPRQTPFGFIVRIVYPEGVLTTSEILFDLYLEGKFPFQPPKLVCESVLGFPSFSDGRDLIFEILKKKWTPSITSADLIGMIPNFFQSVLIPSQKTLSTQEFGQFHLSSPYYLESWERKQQMSTFYCTESNLSKKKEKIIVLTHTTILILDLNPQYPGIGYLVSWATIQSLNSIRRSVKQNDKLTLEWKQIGDNPPYTQVLTINKPNDFIELLSKNMQKNGAIIRRLTGNKLFKEDEVNGKAIKSMNIDEILQAIEVYEDNFESIVNPVMVNTLLELYQRAIEYFAAIGSSQYNIFLKRMQMILSNESVVNVMQGKDEEKKIEKVEKELIKTENHEKINENKVKTEVYQKSDNFEKKKDADDLQKTENNIEKENLYEKVEDNLIIKNDNEFLIEKTENTIEKENLYEKVEDNLIIKNDNEFLIEKIDNNIEKENLYEKVEDNLIIKNDNEFLTEKTEEHANIEEEKKVDDKIITSEIKVNESKEVENYAINDEKIESQALKEEKLENSEPYESIENQLIHSSPVLKEEIKSEDCHILPESEIIPSSILDSNLTHEKPNS